MINSEEELGSGYVAWTPYTWMAARADYRYERYSQDNPLFTTTDASQVTTQRVPLGLNFYHPFGWFAKVTETYINQRVTLSPSLTDDGDKFWLADFATGYRLPKRLGIVSVEVNNLFDRTFRYQDVTGSNPDKYPSILPERVIYTRLTLLF
jgi:outer membrane receptor for ferric coprogen and ferric-rhodotorulic acid